MTKLRLGFAAAILIASMAVTAVGISACTQGTTPDCADAGACGTTPIPLEAGPGDAAAADDGG
jgi:hypothetical protein